MVSESIEGFLAKSEERGRFLSQSVSGIASDFYNEFKFPSLTEKDKLKKIDEELKKYSKYNQDIDEVYLKVNLAPGGSLSDAAPDQFHREGALTIINRMKEDIKTAIDYLIQIRASKRVKKQLRIGYISLGIAFSAIIVSFVLGFR